MPVFSRDNTNTLMHPLGELYFDYLDKFWNKTQHEKLTYVMADEDLMKQKMVFELLNQLYEIVLSRALPGV